MNDQPTQHDSRLRLTVQQLIPILRRRVAGYLPGSRLPGAEQLAEMFNCSLYYARQALAALVEEGLLEARHREGHFVLPNTQAARPMRTVHALVSMPQPGELFQQSILAGASAQCPEYGLQFVATEFDRGQLGQMPPDELGQLSGDADPLDIGWLLVCSVPPARTVNTWMRRGIRLALVDCDLPGTPISSATCNWRQAIYDITETILLLGHRRIAYCGLPPDDSISTARRHGHELALRHYGLEPDPALQWYVDGASPRERHTLTRLLEWLGGENRPSAVVAADHMIGYLVLLACEEVGIRVPQQLSVIAAGFRRRELAGRIDRLTRLDAGPPDRLGRMSVDLIAELPSYSHPVRLFLDFELIKGATVGPPPE